MRKDNIKLCEKYYKRLFSNKKSVMIYALYILWKFLKGISNNLNPFNKKKKKDKSPKLKSVMKTKHFDENTIKSI